jgi:hypothetical protein
MQAVGQSRPPAGVSRLLWWRRMGAATGGGRCRVPLGRNPGCGCLPGAFECGKGLVMAS